MKRFFKKILLFVILIIVGLGLYLFTGRAKPAENIKWGVTFSKGYASDFESDWRKMFLAILDDLKVKNFRLIAYWNEIEKQKGEYDFSELDWQINEVSKGGGEIILAIGKRLPRWPECHIPEWAQNLSKEEQEESIVAYIKETVNRYKNNSNIKIWQIENEPFLRTFGICPKLDKEFLDKEITLVKYLDASSLEAGQARPIMITESGEFSTWIGGARRADIVGTSIYRTIYGKLGYVTYPIPSVFYRKKTNLIKSLFNVGRIIGIEIQAEPWGKNPVKQMDKKESDISMSFEKFNQVIKYAQNTGFNEMYLWGVEWWYWMKQKGDDSYWNRAKELFK
ncbi:MAG TPA: beta-galactosidase [Candidatus Portnoybacteria bacterium]|nr:beta-galactosidase [Candidatus Portnoybacteria bacterium]MDD5752312.1 beta-galactosidase [Candidatus Portnoybacteria bacterium]HNU96811.1 beta-galactosidase [Candidatus Portnoybacteria bacterium]HOZ16304.1 beta-galactosidase [Candidatus Portnoybacteria bacterium]HPH51900.1 beta-galactosidase [Candidatus Portnoybacteria bacterium]